MEEIDAPTVNVALELAGRDILITFIDGSSKKGVYCSEDKQTISLMAGKERSIIFKSAIKYVILGKTKASDQDVIKYVQDEKNKQAAYIAGGLAALQNNAKTPTQ